MELKHEDSIKMVMKLNEEAIKYNVTKFDPFNDDLMGTVILDFFNMATDSILIVDENNFKIYRNEYDGHIFYSTKFLNKKKPILFTDTIIVALLLTGLEGNVL